MKVENKFSTYRGGFPTSTHPGSVSTVTSLLFSDPNSDSSIVFEFDGYKDSKVISYKLPHDTVNNAFFKHEMGGVRPFGYGNEEVLYPGMVWVGLEKLLDETEITNLYWMEFLYHVKEDSSKDVFNKMLPDTSQLPRQDYFNNPFFRY